MKDESDCVASLQDWRELQQQDAAVVMQLDPGSVSGVDGDVLALPAAASGCQEGQESPNYCLYWNQRKYVEGRQPPLGVSSCESILMVLVPLPLLHCCRLSVSVFYQKIRIRQSHEVPYECHSYADTEFELGGNFALALVAEQKKHQWRLYLLVGQIASRFVCCHCIAAAAAAAVLVVVAADWRLHLRRMDSPGISH